MTIRDIVRAMWPPCGIADQRAVNQAVLNELRDLADRVAQLETSSAETNLRASAMLADLRVRIDTIARDSTESLTSHDQRIRPHRQA